MTVRAKDAAMPDTRRLDQLETTLSHLVRMVEELSDVIARQDREIDILKRGLIDLHERSAAAEPPPVNQPPPHW
jgi:SlyX protein